MDMGSLAMTWEGQAFEPIEALASTALAAIDLPRKPTLEQIRQLEARIAEAPQVHCENAHHFGPGVYMREGRIPAGTVVTGRQHRTEHLNILAAGEITVWTEDGMKRLKAPAVIKSMPGAKRVGYAHTNVVWITVHATDLTDVAEIERQLLMPELPAIEGETA